MKIFLITDIHHGEDTNYERLGGLEYVNVYGAQFRDIIPKLYSEIESCDLVVNLGDFIHDTGPEDMETYKEAMKLLETNTTTKHVRGNHDSWNITKEEWAALIGEDKSYYDFDLGGYHHIVLDCNRAENKASVPYLISEEQREWLKSSLEKTSLKTLVYLHHPVDEQSMENNYYFKDHPERSSVTNKIEVTSLLEASQKVLAVFTGHTHFLSDQTVNGIRYITVPSFGENDGSHKPNAKYAIVSLEGDTIEVEIKQVLI